jgi:hypothetical protein
LQGHKALKEQEGLDIALAGGIAFKHGAQIGLGLIDQAGISGIGLLRNLAHTHGWQFLIAKLARQLIGQGAA